MDQVRRTVATATKQRLVCATRDVSDVSLLSEFHLKKHEWLASGKILNIGDVDAGA